MEKKGNLVFIRNPGVEKTHLVIVLGIKAFHQRVTLFIILLVLLDHPLLFCIK
ncbi:hypothetical protein [Marinilactibacillus psychrotolerans]